jgi:DegV family protein with EDD domain
VPEALLPALNNTMSNICILTDSTAQYTLAKYPGHERVHVLPFEVQTFDREGEHSRSRHRPNQRLIPPSAQEFEQAFARLSREYDTIFVLPMSSRLNPAHANALDAVRHFNNHARVHVIDTQTTSIGLGLLVQAAAAAAAEGAAAEEIEQRMRASIPHIYMLFCIPELTTLAGSGYMDYSQALVAEMMGLLPVFSIEEGRLTPIEKVRTRRHLFESFLEYINEFDAPAHIALVRGGNQSTIRARPVRMYVQETFPETPFSEHAISPPLASLFGQQATGLIIFENPD